MKSLLSILLLFTLQGLSQSSYCKLGPPVFNISFGSGYIQDINTLALDNYRRVMSSCPTDGHYTYTSATSNCFRGDWHTLPEDHTPGDVDGNMLLVNASYDGGPFFHTSLGKLKGNTTYEFALWMMNVCRPTEKCPFPLLPNVLIRLQTPSGKIMIQLSAGEVARHQAPHWTQHRVQFTTPASVEPLTLTMINNSPGGCGNDFVVDDITVKECIKVTPVAKRSVIKKVESNRPPASTKAQTKRTTPVKQPVENKPSPKPQGNVPAGNIARTTPKVAVFPAPPAALTRRANPTAKEFQIEKGEIKLDLYDNGEIDGDTVSIFHNNTLVVSHARLSQKPITVRINVSKDNPHHELVMVAENLGSIPPNTSLMMITAGSKRYQVFITSNEQKNSKVVFDLKE